MQGLFRFLLPLGLAAMLIPGIAVAQEGAVIESPITEEVLPLESFDLTPIVREALIEQASTAEKGVVLRALDKISGEVVDFELEPGQTKQLARIQVTLEQCRYPTNNPAGDASAFVVVRNVADQSEAFRGWMIASSPALNGLDHPRYDVWVLRCITS